MLDETFLDRYSRLLETRLSDRDRQFPLELRGITAMASRNGMLHSSVHASQVQHAHERELEVRARIAWESLVRTHQTLRRKADDSVRAALKAEITLRIESFGAALSNSLQGYIQRFLRAPGSSFSLADTQQHLVQKHQVEADLYMDSLMGDSSQNEAAPPTSMHHTYHFYGSVGAVQTGANAQANVVQSLDSEELRRLVQSLSLVREALSHAHAVDSKQKHELLEIAEESDAQLSSDSPNNTKLLTMLTVLGTAVQSIASARPAYEALRSALRPLGITLP